MQKIWTVIRRGWWGAALVLLLEVPVLVYRNVFGSHISVNHTRWSEMGSAMSGIYGPILTVLTLCVLIKQVMLQQATNKHMYDQAYLQTARADMDFYLKQLAEALAEPYSTNLTVHAVLNKWFSFPTLEQLSQEEVTKAAERFNAHCPRVYSIATAIYPMYAGLSSSEEVQYRLQYTSAIQRTIAILGYPTCVALENYIYCLCGHQMPYPAQFSPFLIPRSVN